MKHAVLDDLKPVDRIISLIAVAYELIRYAWIYRCIESSNAETKCYYEDRCISISLYILIEGARIIPVKYWWRSRLLEPWNFLNWRLVINSF